MVALRLSAGAKLSATKGNARIQLQNQTNEKILSMGRLFRRSQIRIPIVSSRPDGGHPLHLTRA
jgi:hypothetical protein